MKEVRVTSLLILEQLSNHPVPIRFEGQVYSLCLM